MCMRNSFQMEVEAVVVVAILDLDETVAKAKLEVMAEVVGETLMELTSALIISMTTRNLKISEGRSDET
jgi:hypothetical protein